MTQSASPLVSIIIPVYNSGKYLAKTIECAIDQTWPNKEVIIVDDGSTDDSLQIALKYESEQVKVISQQNKGESSISGISDMRLDCSAALPASAFAAGR